MYRALVYGLVVALGALLPQLSVAQSTQTPVRGLYIEAGIGANWLEDTDGFYQLRPDHPLLPNLELPAASVHAPGWAIAARLGYAWVSGLRVDGEISYRRNSIEKSKFVGTDGVNFFDRTDEGAHGHTRSFAFMANAYYDFLSASGITPYLGVGFGLANAGGKFESSFNPLLGRTDRISDDDWGFAAQGIGGLSIALSNSMSLVVDYRYFRIFDVSTVAEQPTAPLNPTFAAARLGGRGDYVNHTLMVGLRYSFGRVDVPLK